MKWINCAERLPNETISTTSDKIIIRNASTKHPVEVKYFRSYARGLTNHEWGLENFEWLDEENNEPSFNILDMRKAFNAYYLRGFSHQTNFKSFMKMYYNIDTNEV